MAGASRDEQAPETNGQRVEVFLQLAHAILSFTGRKSQNILRLGANLCALVIDRDARGLSESALYSCELV